LFFPKNLARFEYDLNFFLIFAAKFQTRSLTKIKQNEKSRLMAQHRKTAY